jgi:hypothetical protein
MSDNFMDEVREAYQEVLDAANAYEESWATMELENFAPRMAKALLAVEALRKEWESHPTLRRGDSYAEKISQAIEGAGE